VNRTRTPTQHPRPTLFYIAGTHGRHRRSIKHQVTAEPVGFSGLPRLTDGVNNPSPARRANTSSTAEAACHLIVTRSWLWRRGLAGLTPPLLGLVEATPETAQVAAVAPGAVIVPSPGQHLLSEVTYRRYEQLNSLFFHTAAIR
jgi:hypothetical protein